MRAAAFPVSLVLLAAGCSLVSLDEFVRGAESMGSLDGGASRPDGGAPGSPSPDPRVLIFGGENGTETLIANFDARGQLVGFTAMNPVSAPWSGAAFVDGEIVVVNNDEVLRAPWDGGPPVPWTRRPSRGRPDNEGSIVVGRGVAVASMGQGAEYVWTAAITEAGLSDWEQQPATTSAQRRDPRILTDGRFVWLIGGEAPVDVVTGLIEVGRLDGTDLPSFRQTTPLPMATSEPAVALAPDRLVVCGGSRGRRDARQFIDRCVSAPVEAETGEVGPFVDLPPLPYSMYGGAMVLVRGRLTLFGARGAAMADDTARIFSLQLDGGTAWERLPLTLPAPRWLEDAKVLVP
ncbi:MAG: hypothetical protein MUC96_28640 [Myxococcaceae bacterium]|jgi:hypothetical protein|nr:hypothetical protein [Myxococcaceae bacterium]